MGIRQQNCRQQVSFSGLTGSLFCRCGVCSLCSTIFYFSIRPSSHKTDIYLKPAFTIHVTQLFSHFPLQLRYFILYNLYMDTIFNEDYFNSPHLNIIPPQLPRLAFEQEAAPPFLVTRVGYFPKTNTFSRISEKGCPHNILLFCSDGKGYFSVSNQAKCFLKAGQGVLIPAGTPYEFGTYDSNCWTVYWLHLQGAVSHVFDTSFFPGQIYNTLEGYQSFILEQFTHCFRILQKPCQQEELLLLYQMANSILSILIYANKKAELPITQKGRYALRSAAYYMRLHLKEALTLEQIAKETGLSSSHLTHVFKVAVHHTPVDYFLRLKKHAAAEELCFTNKPIKQVAANYGIQDPYYFSRLFKKVIGVSPSEYRETVWE